MDVSSGQLLIDENLPRSLVSRLADIFPDARHVCDLNLIHASDDVIWERAKALGLAVITKDSDFAERVTREGPPPSIVWLRIGNCSVRQIVATLRENASAVNAHIAAGRGLLTLTPMSHTSSPQ